MRTSPRAAVLCGLAAASLCLSPGTSSAAPMQSAVVTRVQNDVSLVTGEGSRQPAQAGDEVRGRTAVETGAKSRAELRFPDNTLTRIGSNSQFSFQTGTRNLSLEKGVMFLQVPKDAGGAQIRTAAVTAAITGTTILIEFAANGAIKIIVIEGTLDAFFNEDESEFITLTAGQMIILPPGADRFPAPVDVDLARLLATSQLANDEKFTPQNADNQVAVNNAVQNQGQLIADGTLSPTNLVIPGQGSTVLVLNRETTLSLPTVQGALVTLRPPPRPPGQTPPPPASSPGGGGGDPLLGPPPLLSGQWIVDPDMTVRPDGPLIAQPDRGGRGSFYLPDQTGPLHPWLFGADETLPGEDLAAALAGTGTWAAYLLEEIRVGGTPLSVGEDVVPNVLFASARPVMPATEVGGPLDFGPLRNFGLFTQDADIVFTDPSLRFSGADTNVIFHTNGPGGSIDLATLVNLGDGNFSTFSGGDVMAQPGSAILAKNWTSRAEGNLAVNSTIVRADQKVDLEARGNVDVDVSDISVGSVANVAVNVESSDQLAALVQAAGSGGRVQVVSREGDVTMTGSTIVEANGSGGSVEILAPAGDVSLDGEPSRLVVRAADAIRVEAGGGPQPTISLLGVTLNAANVNLRSTGPNATINLKNTQILASATARIYAEGTNSLVQMAQGVTLTGSSVRIAGQTIRVLPGATVDATGVGTLCLHADAHHYNLPWDEKPYGYINLGETTQVHQTDYAGRHGPCPPTGGD